MNCQLWPVIIEPETRQADPAETALGFVLVQRHTAHYFTPEGGYSPDLARALVFSSLTSAVSSADATRMCRAAKLVVRNGRFAIC